MSEGFWWTAVAIATLSAIVHIGSMLGTHWGDRGASIKALIFSLLVHLSMFCGLFAVAPTLDRIGRATEPPPETEPLTIHEVLSDSDVAIAAEETGNVPLWDRPGEIASTPQDRSDRPFELPDPVETERTVEPLAAIDRPLPSLEELPETPDVAPETTPAEIPEMRAEAARPLEVDQETAEARTEQRPPLARTDRSPAAAAGEDEPLERAALPAASDRLATEFDPQKQLADLRGADEPARLPAMESEEDALRIDRPTAPLPLPAEELAGAGGPSEGTEGDAALSSRFSRRPMRSRDFGGTLPSQERGDSESESPSIPRRDRTLSSIDRPLPVPGDLPRISRPDSAPLTERRQAVPETYQLRAIDKRSEVARQNGGTEASEQSVELSLKWLAAHQNAAGFWDADAHGAGQVGVDEEGVNRQHAGKTADSGLTALAVLAFLGAGYTQTEGPYTETVEKALDWLIANQRADGFLGGEAAHFEQMYCHGMATYALAEAYGMQSDKSNSRLRRPLEKAVLYIAAQQGQDGGWRYVKGQAGDMSMFGWQLMALKSAEIGGVPMPGASRSKMIQFLKDRSLGDDGGLAAYRDGLRATPAMTAEAMFCKQMLGMTRTNPASVEAVSYLLKNAPRRSELNYYYWYYGTLAMFQYGGKAWETWNASLRDLLIAEQTREGDDAGSWPPRDAWGSYGGRVYSTAVATLSLEVYYRFLPLYRTSQRVSGEPTAGR